MLKKIKIPANINIKFCIIKAQKLLILILKDNSYYFNVPSDIECSKDETFLFFKISDNIKEKKSNLSTFFNYIDKRFKSIEKLFCKKVILKGLGLKANLTIDSKILELKLGYSHMIIINIPIDIKILINKSVVSIEGFNEVSVGNFAFNIRKLKFPNIYKGKGIWYKNEIKILKTIKKT